MSDFLITVLMVSDGDAQAEEVTLGSLPAGTDRETVRTQVIRTEGKDSVWRSLERAMRETQTPYLTVVHAGDRFGGQALAEAVRYFETVREETDVLMLRCSYCSADFPGSLQDSGPRLLSLEREEEILRVPFYYESVILRTDSTRDMQFDERHGFEIWEEFLYRLLDKRKTIGYAPSAVMSVAHASKSQFAENKDNIRKEWYLGTARNHWLALIDMYARGDGSLPLFMQYRVLYSVKIRFAANLNRNDRHALTAPELEEFFALCRQVLEHIDDSLLIQRSGAAKGTGLSAAMSHQLLNIKYDGRPDVSYYLDRKQPEQALGVFARLNGRELGEIPLPNVCLDVTNYSDGKLILEFSCAPFLRDGEVRLRGLLNGREIPCEPTVRYLHTGYFGTPGYQEHTFRVTLPCGEMKAHNELSFEARCRDERLQLPVVSGRYTSRISWKASRSCWNFDRYMLCFQKSGRKRQLQINRVNRADRIRWEIRRLRHMSKGSALEQKMAKQRIRYWLAYPFYHRKNIWLTFDKIYKGGDCGEYFYKYMMSRRDTDVVPVYVINADAPDRKRLEKEGYRPTIFGTRRHWLQYLYAKMVFATHAGLYNFNGISDEEIPYLQDLIRADAACIQHGLSVQDLAFNSNRAFNNNKRYYCASRYEVENLLQPIYGYDDPSVLRLTGIPRFDGLVSDDRRQILIAPTWRNYITLPSEGRNTAKPYFEGFKETDYFRVYEELLSDEKLRETAKKTGYRLIFLVHPNISAQTGDFTAREGVEIVSAVDASYERLLTQSSLMVTDYSGIQFDFAYMRKPIVYYHTPILPPHYVEGGFFYDTQGFGEICTRQRELVDVLCGYMEGGCALKPFYEAREDDFFAFRDHNSCQRIFEDALAYQREARQ